MVSAHLSKPFGVLALPEVRIDVGVAPCLGTWLAYCFQLLSPRRCSEQARESADKNLFQYSLSRRRLGKGFGQDRLRDIPLEAVTSPIRTASCSIVGCCGPSIVNKRAPGRWNILTDTHVVNTGND